MAEKKDTMIGMGVGAPALGASSPHSKWLLCLRRSPGYARDLGGYFRDIRWPVAPSDPEHGTCLPNRWAHRGIIDRSARAPEESVRDRVEHGRAKHDQRDPSDLEWCEIRVSGAHRRESKAWHEHREGE